MLVLFDESLHLTVGANTMWKGNKFFGEMMSIWITVIILVTMVGVNQISFRGKNRKSEYKFDSALDILNRRLANGDIDETEYLALKQAMDQ